jgi:hypothetical protein
MPRIATEYGAGTVGQLWKGRNNAGHSNHPGTGPGERHCDPATQATARAGNDRGLAGQVAHGVLQVMVLSPGASSITSSRHQSTI